MIIQHMIFFGTLFSLLLGVQQFLKIKSRLNIWSGILFLCLSWGLFRALLQNNIPASDRQAIIPILTSVVTAAIALQAYFRTILQTEDPAFYKVCNPVILIGITVITDILIIIFTGSMKQSGSWETVLSLVHLAGGIFLSGSLLRYLIPQFSILLKSRFSFTVFYTFSISAAVLVLIVFGLLGEGSGSVIFKAIYSVGFTILLILIFFLSKIRPEILDDLRHEAIKARYLKTSLSGINKSELKSRLDHLMKNENLFQDERCSLKSVASELSLSAHQLSEYLNKDLNTSFSNYVNSFRIKTAISILKQSPDKTILEAAFEAGFGNKSSFNEAFRRETGMTPREYRKKSQKL